MKSTNKKKSLKRKKSVFPVIELSFRSYRNICIMLFILLAYHLTLCCNYNFLIWAEELSLFIPGRLFFDRHVIVPGGLLSYAGSFLTQFFYLPVLGCTLFILLLFLLQYLVRTTFCISGKYTGLSFIPSGMLLLSVTQVEYLLHTLKTPGYLYAGLLGITVTLLFFILYRKINFRPLKSILPVIYISTYQFFGFYTLLAVFLCVLYEILFFIKDKNTYRFFPVVTGLFMILVVPYISYVYTNIRIQWQEIYIAGLPKFYFTQDELIYWIPFLILFFSILFFFVFLLKKQPVEKEVKIPLLNRDTFIFIILLAGIYLGSYRNENFKTELKMTRAVENNDWEKVISLGKELKSSPTRLIIMYQNLALYKLGRAGDEMFAVDNVSVLPKTKRPTLILMHLGAKPVYFQYGKINYCYRWCMEDMSEYGMNVNLLKYMVKCAIMNEEFPLARKYNNVLKKTFFHKNWAEKYQKYIDNPESGENDPEMKAIRPLMAYDNVLDGDGGLLEIYLLNNFAYLEGGPPELVELSLQCNLILKNIERFWPRFFLYARTHKRLPAHYQEAALLYSHLEKKVDISKINFDQEIVARFNQLVTLSETYQYRSDEENRKAFKPVFGDTYWYYYFFIKDIKSN
ncbi:MAG: DUF6057 family protein [Candidatus Azobacteroides sp.]|nr:DUF6057 family protein [Candidatus Azobacteroides sp.]